MGMWHSMPSNEKLLDVVETLQLVVAGCALQRHPWPISETWVWQYYVCMSQGWGDGGPMLVFHTCSLCIKAVVGFHWGMALQSCLKVVLAGLLNLSQRIALRVGQPWHGRVKPAAHTVRSARACRWKSTKGPVLSQMHAILREASLSVDISLQQPRHPGCRPSGTKSCSSKRRGRAA